MATPTAPPAPTVEDASHPDTGVSSWMTSLPEIETQFSNTPQPAAPPPPPTPPAKPAVPAPAAEPPAPPKPPEATQAPPVAPEPEDEDKWPRDAKDWEKFRAKRKAKEDKYQAELKALAKERDEHRAELEKVKTTGSPELEALKKERDDYAERLRLLAVERDPRFEAYFSGKVNGQIDNAKAIVGPTKAEQVERLLRQPDSEWRTSQLEAVIEGLSPWQQARMAGVVNELGLIDREKQSEISKYKQNYEKISQQEQESRKQTQKQAMAAHETAFNDFIKEAQGEKGLAIFQKRVGDDAWNKEVDSRIDAAKNLVFGKLTPQQVAQAASHAAGFPAMLSFSRSLMQENTSLKEQIAKLQAATPTVQPTNRERPTTQPEAQRPKPGTNPMDVSRQWAQEMVAARNG